MSSWTKGRHPGQKGVILNSDSGSLTKEIPDQVRNDTLGVPNDTLDARNDTFGTSNDTLGARNDTLGARNDTLGVRNDTSPLPKKIPRSKKVKKKASPVKNQEGISINLNLNGGII